MSSNPQYADPPFGMTGIASTGAPGSPSAGDAPESGAVIGRPGVSVPYASSQVPANMPTVAVTVGDTSGMSADSPTAGAVGGDRAEYVSHGPHTGRTTTRHPNAGM